MTGYTLGSQFRVTSFWRTLTFTPGEFEIHQHYVPRGIAMNRNFRIVGSSFHGSGQHPPDCLHFNNRTTGHIERKTKSNNTDQDESNNEDWRTKLSTVRRNDRRIPFPTLRHNGNDTDEQLQNSIYSSKHKSRRTYSGISIANSVPFDDPSTVPVKQPCRTSVPNSVECILQVARENSKVTKKTVSLPQSKSGFCVHSGKQESLGFVSSGLKDTVAVSIYKLSRSTSNPQLRLLPGSSSKRNSSCPWKPNYVREMKINGLRPASHAPKDVPLFHSHCSSEEGRVTTSLESLASISGSDKQTIGLANPEQELTQDRIETRRSLHVFLPSVN